MKIILFIYLVTAILSFIGDILLTTKVRELHKEEIFKLILLYLIVIPLLSPIIFLFLPFYTLYLNLTLRYGSYDKRIKIINKILGEPLIKENDISEVEDDNK